MMRVPGKFLMGNFGSLVVSESLGGLGFAKATQRFIYRRITVAMGGCHHQPVTNVIRISIAPL
jgi:hypothetical protein